MKAAFVLGLAVAATAQVDNEFATYNPSGANLVRDAGWGRSNPIGYRVPRDYNTEYLNKYGLKHDDAADDEMMVYYTKDSRGVNQYQGGYTRRDDTADDEMMVYYTKDSRGVKHYEGGFSRDDAADDEMMVYYTKDSRGVNQYQGGYTRRDDAADDELVSYPYVPSGRSLPTGYRVPRDYNTEYLNKYGLTHDDAADDEMMVYYTKDSRGVKHYEGGFSRDDAADDEMMVYYTKDSRGVKHYEGGFSRDDAADDEMMVYYTKDSRGVNQYQGGYTRRDDAAADDELVALGHLIKETQPEKVEKKKSFEKPRKFRPVEKN